MKEPYVQRCAQCNEKISEDRAAYSLMALIGVRRMRERVLPPLHATLCTLKCVAAYAAAQTVDEVAQMNSRGDAS